MTTLPHVLPAVPAGRRPSAAALWRLLLGLLLFGFGIAAMVAADLGLAPWDVLHQGISNHTGIPIGTVGIGVGILLLLAFPLLKEKIGLGTVLNVLVIGIVIDVTLLWLDTPGSLAVRWVMMLSGIVLIAIGSGWYIGAGLGPGPRDGLMTGLAKRGINVGVVRTAIEIGVLGLGILLSGTAGAGTLAFALGIGPLVAFFLPRLALDKTVASPPVAAAD